MGGWGLIVGVGKWAGMGLVKFFDEYVGVVLLLGWIQDLCRDPSRGYCWGWSVNDELVVWGYALKLRLSRGYEK